MRSSEMPATDDHRRPIDLDALTMDDVRAGALAGRAGDGPGPRTERDRAGAVPRRRGRAGDGLRRPARRRPGGASRDWAIATSTCGSGRTSTRRPPGRAPRSSPPRPRSPPTTRRPSRACDPAPGARRAARRRRRLRARAGRRGGPVPAPVPGADDRRHGHQGQDDHVLAGPRDPRRRPGPPRGPRRQHRHAADRAPARAHARPPRGHRAVRAPAADAVARARPSPCTRT